MITRSCRRRLQLDTELSEVFQQQSGWTDEEDEKLLSLMKEFGQSPWSFVSSHFSGKKSINDCYKRWELIQSLKDETLSSPTGEIMFPSEVWLDAENISTLAADPQLENRISDGFNQVSIDSIPEEKKTSFQIYDTSGSYYIDPNSIQELVALYGSPVDMKQVCNDLLHFLEEELSKTTEDPQTYPKMSSTQL